MRSDCRLKNVYQPWLTFPLFPRYLMQQADALPSSSVNKRQKERETAEPASRNIFPFAIETKHGALLDVYGDLTKLDHRELNRNHFS